MNEDTIIDLKDAARAAKDKWEEKWKTEHTHFMDLMQAIIPAMNLVGEPIVSVGWLHVVQRAKEWRRMLASQQTILDTAVRAIDHGQDIQDIKALLSIQRQQLDWALDMWEPAPIVPAEE